MPNQTRWDPTFLDESMDIVREMVDDAIKSRRKVFEETYTMTTYGARVDTIVITVKASAASAGCNCSRPSATSGRS